MDKPTLTTLPSLSDPHSPKHPIRAIFFDLNGTLFTSSNNEQAWNGWFSALFESFLLHGLHLSRAEFSAMCDGFFNPSFAFTPSPLNSTTKYEARLEHLAIKCNLTIPNSQFSQIAGKTIEAWGEYMYLDPEAQCLLQRLQSSYILGLITNFDHPPYIYELLHVSQLDRYFKVIVISGEIGIDKPDPAIFHHAFRETNLLTENLNLLPEETLYIGDSPTHDVQGALNAGMIPILLSRNTSEDPSSIYDYYHDSHKETTLPQSFKETSRTQTCQIIHNLSELGGILTLPSKYGKER
ncbi:MAG: HAD family hydrolase [Promethearchaeota archaeon]|nr:MAG: HAD family hydrolase [Candidatus Lokiarchaeota archaeon]